MPHRSSLLFYDGSSCQRYCSCVPDRLSYFGPMWPANRPQSAIFPQSVSKIGRHRSDTSYHRSTDFQLSALPEQKDDWMLLHWSGMASLLILQLWQYGRTDLAAACCWVSGIFCQGDAQIYTLGVCLGPVLEIVHLFWQACASLVWYKVAFTSRFNNVLDLIRQKQRAKTITDDMSKLAWEV